MTMKQSLHLCKRRRPVVDPIPAFVEQLKIYERECRTWGHLTSEDNVTFGAQKGVSEKVEGDSSNVAGVGVGEKRKANNDDGSGDGKKKRAVGPAIGPSIGPSIGPMKPQKVGPTKPTTAAIGPAPSKDSKQNVGGKGSDNESKGIAEKRGEGKKKVIGPMKPPA